MVFLDDAVGGGGFEPAAGLDVDDLGIDGDPFSGVVFVVDADLVDVGELDGLFRDVGDLAAALVDHRGDDAVGDAGVFEGDERVGVGGVRAGLGVDGLDDEVVAEARLRHLHDGVVVHRRGLGWRSAGRRRLGCVRRCVVRPRRQERRQRPRTNRQRAQQCVPTRHRSESDSSRG